MKRLLFAATFALSASGALAAPITVTLDDGTAGTSNDQATISKALDDYAKAEGINALLPGAILLQKLQAAVQAASVPPAVTPAPSTDGAIKRNFSQSPQPR